MSPRLRVAAAKLIGYESKDDEEEDEGDENGDEDDEYSDEDLNKDEDIVDYDVGGMDKPAHRAIPFAGGEVTHLVPSILNGAHSIGEGILGFLAMLESKSLCWCL